jgi:thioredoxin reductase
MTTNSDIMSDHDVIVVGGSIAGLSAAMPLVRARRRVLVIDAGAPRNRFSVSSHGVFGHDGKSPAEMIGGARAQVLAYPTARVIEGRGVRASRRDDGFAVELESGAIHTAARLILATGIVDELPDMPGLRERWGRTVLHCPYCHGYETGGGHLGVLATGPTAIHQAMLLPDWGDEVTLFTNGAVEPDDEQRAALAARGVRIEERRVTGLIGETPALDAVTLEDGEIVPVRAIFTASRTRLASPLAEQLGCELDEGPFGPVIRTDAFKATTVPGVFAAGDAARMMHNASWAIADGVMAGTATHQSLVFG